MCAIPAADLGYAARSLAHVRVQSYIAADPHEMRISNFLMRRLQV